MSYIPSPKNLYFILRLTEENLTFFLVLIAPGFPFYYNWFLFVCGLKNKSHEWGGGFMSGGDYEIWNFNFKREVYICFVKCRHWRKLGKYTRDLCYLAGCEFTVIQINFQLKSIQHALKNQFLNQTEKIFIGILKPATMLDSSIQK